MKTEIFEEPFPRQPHPPTFYPRVCRSARFCEFCSMKKWVIGDIHSGLRALHQVLDRASIVPGDLLIFLGDYVDGWSQAVETVDFLIGLRDRYDCIFLRGNHDELCREWLAGNAPTDLWLQHGGQATMDSYAHIDPVRRELHLDFLTRLDNYYLDQGKRLFLHAGFTNQRGVEFEYFDFPFYWDRTLWETALALDPGLDPGHPYYPKRLTHYTEVYIGHTPVTRIGKTIPQHMANVWNLDTGAGFMGPLTIMDIDTKEYWQSEPVYTLYPGENGRN